MVKPTTSLALFPSVSLILTPLFAPSYEIGKSHLLLLLVFIIPWNCHKIKQAEYIGCYHHHIAPLVLIFLSMFFGIWGGQYFLDSCSYKWEHQHYMHILYTYLEKHLYQLSLAIVNNISNIAQINLFNI